MGFEPTITAFERAKTIHTLDHADTVIGGLTHIAKLIHRKGKKTGKVKSVLNYIIS
jgi:hypothetical protein